MSQRIYRVLFVLFVLAFSARMFAQSEIGISINGSELDETRFDDGEEEITIDFDEGIGLGLTYNHFFGPRFSVEGALNTLSADMNVGASGGPAVEAGEISALALTGMGLFHFNTDGRFQPYLGGGIAFIGGEFEPNIAGEDAIDLETDTTWTVALGANIRVTERVFISVESKYIEWGAKPEDEPESDRLDLDPLLLSAGVKFRF